MARNRKSKQPTSASEIPLRKPPRSEETEISEEEQWRLIKKSGLLSKIDMKPPELSKDENVAADDEKPLAEEIFDTTLYLIPFSFLLMMMEMYASLDEHWLL
jgi:hypothetical protein